MFGTSAEIFVAGMKVRVDEGGGRILLGDKTDGEPIRFQCAGVWVPVYWSLGSSVLEFGFKLDSLLCVCVCARGRARVYVYIYLFYHMYTCYIWV